MKTQNFWEDFTRTGKIEDYLEYKGSNEISNVSSDRNVSSGRNESKNSLKIEKKVGDTPYAGFSNHNRNDTKHDSYR